MPRLFEVASEVVAQLDRRLGARDEALELIAAATERTVNEVLMDLGAPFPADAAPRLAALVARRGRGEPLAYLTGWAPFDGHRFAVTPDVLIPRPETELLVDWAAAWLDRRREPVAVIDVGTGSGAILVSLMLRRPECPMQWHASDSSPAALAVAERNAARLAPAACAAWFHGDLLPPSPAQFDLIVANLPYVGTDELAEVQPSVVDFEPHSALFGGPDGTDPIRRLLASLPRRLAPGGAAVLEIGWRQGAAVVAAAEAMAAASSAKRPVATITLHKDWNDLDRMVTIIW